MVEFEIDDDTRFRVDAGEVVVLGTDPTDIVFVELALAARPVGGHTPGNSDVAIAEATIAYWKAGRIVQQPEPPPPGDPGVDY
jgi:hypothetical protein